MNTGRHDLDAIRDAVSVADVLRAAGVDVPGRHGRCACPLHGGTNRSAFAISADGRRWTCWSCAEHGDALDLAGRLFGLKAFRDQLAYLARLGGIDLGSVPLDLAELERRRTIARRRRNLTRWRNNRLRELADELRRLERMADLAAAALTAARGTPDEGTEWRVLGMIHDAITDALADQESLERRDEQSWLGCWDRFRSGKGTHAA